MNFFPSLREFQDAHRVLLHRYRSAGSMTPELLSEIDRLLQMGCETGRVLDSLSDQRAAQGMLDYWFSILYRQNKEASEPVLLDFDPTAALQLTQPDCPYIALQNVNDTSGIYLFGREGLVREMIGRLQEGNFLAVIGPFGSGRSSLVNGGLLPALARGELPGSEKWPIHHLTPPLQDLSGSIGQDPTCVVILDDCDEIFARGTDEDQSSFAAHVLVLADKPGVRRIIVLILHSDYEDRFARFPDLQERIKRSNVRVTSPTAKELRNAIERPAERVGLKFDENVVEKIIQEIVGERAAFTLLQFTMLRLWECRTHNRITSRTLQVVGAGRAALVRAAQILYDGLSSEQQSVLRPILVRLGSSIRPSTVLWRTLVECSAEPEQAQALLKALQQARLIVVREPGYDKELNEYKQFDDYKQKEKIVRLTHEALVENWKVLSYWLDEEQEQLKHHTRLEAKAQEWRRLGRRKDAGLLSELELLEAEQWLDSPEGGRIGASDDVLQLMEVSRRQHRRKLRYRTVAAVVSTIFAAAFAVVAMFAASKWFEAEQASTEAWLQAELNRLNYIELQIIRLLRENDSKQAFVSQLKRSELQVPPDNSARKQELIAQADVIEREMQRLGKSLDVLTEDRSQTVSRLTKENLRRWNSDPASKQDEVIERILRGMSDAHAGTLEGKLRLGLFALAAIPKNVPKLNDALGDAIRNYRLHNVLTPPGSQQVWAVAFNPQNNNQAAIGDELGRVWIWDPIEGPQRASDGFSAAGDIVNGLAFSPDGTKLAAAYRSSGAVVWDIASKKELCSLGRRSRPAAAGMVTAGAVVGNTYGVAFAPTKQVLAVAGGRSVQLWDLSAAGCPPLPQAFLHSDEVFGVAFSPNGDMLATASGNGNVAIWPLDQAEKPVLEFLTRSPVYAVGFSPNGRVVGASAGARGQNQNGQGFLWDIETGRQTELEIQDGTVGQIAFSPDGKLVVATARADGTVIVSDASTGAELDRLGGEENQVFGVAFSPNSRFLLTGYLSGVARLWNLDKNPLSANDRETLIRAGTQRLLDMALTPNECRILRDMNIPIFVLSDHTYEKERGFICPLPFLGPVRDKNIHHSAYSKLSG